MKLGIASAIPHFTPEEFAQKHKENGLEAVVFPCQYYSELAKIDAYVAACRDYGLTIAEVGAWSNIISPDEKVRQESITTTIRQLELAEYIGAECCINTSGSKGIWDGPSAENYSEQTYQEIVTCVQDIIDAVKPKNTFFTLEPMPWTYPDSPESYLRLLQDVDREAFAVHMDIVNMINDPKKYQFNKEFTTDVFSKLGDHIKSCHIKDIKMVSQSPLKLNEVAVGEGVLDLKHYIQEAEKIAPEMSMIIEHLDRIEDYFESIRYIRQLMEE